MDVPTEIIILVIAVLILAAVGYVQLRYIRNKKETRLSSSTQQDDAYNTVATTKAVASSLHQNGRDTKEADLLIYQAESAYERHEYDKCLHLCNEAKTALRNSREKDLMNAPAPPPEPKEEKEAKAEGSTVVPATQAKKLPTNYLESKFVIDTVKGMMNEAPEDKKAEAKGFCDEAEEHFEKESYTDALRMAMKAKRCLAGPSKPEASKSAAVERISAPEPASKPAASHAPVPTIRKEGCPKCGAEMSEDDVFCGACGSMKGERTCPSCSKKAAPEDAFCRKCGTKI
jgi:hypothetical protein